MGKQVRPSIIALLASVLLVLSAVVGIVAALPDGSTVSDEVTGSDDDLTLFKPRRIWELAGPNYGYDPSGPASYNALGLLVPTDAPPPRGDPNPTGPAFYNTRPFYSYLLSFDSGPTPAELESDALLATLSPGVRANHDGAVLAQEDAKKREHERDEAAYAVSIEEHLPRLNEERPSRK